MWTIPLKGHLPDTQDGYWEDGASHDERNVSVLPWTTVNVKKYLTSECSDWPIRIKYSKRALTGTFALHTNPDLPQSSFDDTLKRATWEQPWQLCSTVSPCVSVCSRCVYWHWHIFPGAGGMLVKQGKAVPAICQMLCLSPADTSLWTLQFRERERANLQNCVKCEHKQKCACFPLYFAPCKAAVRKPVLFMKHLVYSQRCC